MTNCTFARNSARRGGGLFAGFDINITNCIFWDNEDVDGVNVTKSAGVVVIVLVPPVLESILADFTVELR